jgi:hypothetical protein
MIRRSILGICTLTALGLITLSGDGLAQQKTLKEQLVGTWTLVSYDVTPQNGTKQPFYGSANTKGMLILDAIAVPIRFESVGFPRG